MEHKKIQTSENIWLAIMGKHRKEMGVFSTYSAPNGDFLGNPSEGVMMTEYGFRGACCPTIGAKTRWEINREKPYERVNEKHEYWLCLPVEGDD